MPVPFTLVNPELCCCNFGGYFYILRHSDTVFLNEAWTYNKYISNTKQLWNCHCKCHFPISLGLMHEEKHSFLPLWRHSFKEILRSWYSELYHEESYTHYSSSIHCIVLGVQLLLLLVVAIILVVAIQLIVSITDCCRTIDWYCIIDCW